MDLKQEEGAVRSLIMMDGWMDEGRKAFSIIVSEERGV